MAKVLGSCVIIMVWCLLEASTVPPTPPEEGMIVSDIDSARMLTALDSFNSGFNHITEVLNVYKRVTSSVRNMADMSGVVGVTSVTGTLLSVAKIFTKVVGKGLSMFSATKRNQEIDRYIAEINQKLDSIYAQLLAMEQNLKSSVEFNTWMSTYSLWVENIVNGQKKLAQTYQMFQIPQDDKTRMKLLNEYLTYYENNDIEGSFNSLFNAATKTSSTNAFRLFINEKNCIVHDVTRLYFIFQNSLMSASVQKSVYKYLKYGDWDMAEMVINDDYPKFYQVRGVYYDEVWFCVRYMTDHATKEIRTSIVSSNDGKDLTETLNQKFPLYEWSALIYDNWDNEFKDFCSSALKKDTKPLVNRGDSYILVNEAYESSKEAIAVFAHVDEMNLTEGNCPKAPWANTKVFFPAGIKPEPSEKILTHFDCPTHTIQIIHQGSTQCHRFNDVTNVGFIVTQFRHSFEPYHCDVATDICKNDGICQNIQFSDDFYCDCKPFYDGRHCENLVIPDVDEEISALIVELRLHSKTFTGVPDIIDVYFEIREVSHKLSSIHSSLQNDIEFNRVVTLGGNTWSRTSFITSEYSKLLKGDISEAVFHQRLSKLDNSVYYTLSTNDQLVRGTHAGQRGVDFLTTFKRSAFDITTGCSSEYRNNAEDLKQQIILTDQILTEVWIKQRQYGMSQLSELSQHGILKDIQSEITRLKGRWKEYLPMWMEASCPDLNTIRLRNGCPAPHSLETMELIPDCGNEAYPTAEKVVCTKTENGLQWLPDAKCIEYTWLNWGSWSSCSVTCDGGTRSRTRMMGNGTSETSTGSCETQDCCQATYGKFKCDDNSTCIRTSLLCNGDFDCPSSEDEVNCAHIQSGSAVRMYFAKENKYVDGRQSPLTMSTGYTSSQRFYITFHDTHMFNGRGIRSGDIVSFSYSSKTSNIWLSCPEIGKRCVRRIGSFSVYADLFRIYVAGGSSGQLITPYLNVGLKQVISSKHWFSDNKGKPDTNSCPGSYNYFSSAKANDCSREVLRLYKY